MTGTTTSPRASCERLAARVNREVKGPSSLALRVFGCSTAETPTALILRALDIEPLVA